MNQAKLENQQKFEDTENKLEELSNEIGKKENACDMESFFIMAINKCNENTDKKFGRYLRINIAKEIKEEDNMVIEAENNKRKYPEETGGNQIKCLSPAGRNAAPTRRSSATRS
jgi:hypothetical protein